MTTHTDQPPTGPWSTYAGYTPDHDRPKHVGPWHTMKFYNLRGPAVRAAELVEDPAGEWMGWLARDPKTGAWAENPRMVYPAHVFHVCFPGGYEAEEKRGHGRAVRVRIEPS